MSVLVLLDNMMVDTVNQTSYCIYHPDVIIAQYRRER